MARGGTAAVRTLVADLGFNFSSSFSTAGESCRGSVELLIIMAVSCETGMREEGGDDKNIDSQRYTTLGKAKSQFDKNGKILNKFV